MPERRIKDDGARARYVAKRDDPPQAYVSQRWVNGMFWPDYQWYGATDLKYPLKIVMGCGGEKIIRTPNDWPEGDIPCDCPDSRCFFFKAFTGDE